jgi:xanthine dehydrogenase accessory factor
VKRDEIYEKLKTNDGITEDALNKVHCPIGLEIGSETPEEIAVSIVAELIKVRRSLK